MFLLGGCSKAPADKDEVTVTFVLSGNPQVITMTWPPSQGQKKALQAAASKMQDGDKVSVTVPGFNCQGGEYQVRESDEFEIMRLQPDGEDLPQISGASGRKEHVLGLLVGHILKDVKNAASFVKESK